MNEAENPAGLAASADVRPARYSRIEQIPLTPSFVGDLLEHFHPRRYQDVLDILAALEPMLAPVGKAAMERPRGPEWNLVQDLMYAVNDDLFVHGLDPQATGNLPRQTIRAVIYHEVVERTPLAKVPGQGPAAWMSHLTRQLTATLRGIEERAARGRAHAASAERLRAELGLARAAAANGIAMLSCLCPPPTRTRIYRWLAGACSDAVAPGSTPGSGRGRDQEPARATKFLVNELVHLLAFSERAYGLGAMTAWRGIDRAASSGADEASEDDREWIDHAGAVLIDADDFVKFNAGLMRVLDAHEMFLDAMSQAGRGRDQGDDQ
jgi:hypothetical protein